MGCPGWSEREAPWAWITQLSSAQHRAGGVTNRGRATLCAELAAELAPELAATSQELGYFVTTQ